MCFLYLIEQLFCFCFHLFCYVLIRMIHAAHLSECIVYLFSCSLIMQTKQSDNMHSNQLKNYKHFSRHAKFGLFLNSQFDSQNMHCFKVRLWTLGGRWMCE